MLYVFFGNDTTRVRTGAFDFLHTLTEEEANVTRITLDTYQVGMITDLAESVSLFATPQIVVLDTLNEQKVKRTEDAQQDEEQEIESGGAFTEVVDSLSALQKSSNTFIIIEGVLSAPLKKKFETCAVRVHEVSSEKKKPFNIFALCDAFLLRDKKSLWLLFMEAQRNGSTNEEILGTLFWQMKILRLAEKTTSAEEAGQKQYPYDKAKRALTKFKKGELETMSRELLIIYHEGHMGKRDMSLALEEWVLRV